MRPRALFLTHEYPWPADAGWKLRAFQSLAAVSSRFDVHLVALTESGVADSDQQALRAHCEGVKAVTLVRHDIRIRRRPLKLAAALLKAFTRNAPYSMSKFHSRPIVAAIRKAFDGFQPDLVYVCNLHLLESTRVALVGATLAPLVLESQNVEYRMWEDFVPLLPRFQRLLARRERLLLRAYEISAWSSADGVVAIAPEDAEIIARDAPRARVKYIATSMLWRHEVAPTGGPPVAVGLIGNWSWPPNQFSLRWFIDEVVPHLEALGERPRIRIAGAGLSRDTRERATARGCEVLGYVDSAADFYASIDLTAAPDIVGGGVRLKVLNALAAGLPVVGTAISFRGLQVSSGTEAFVVSTAEEMARDLATLLRSRETRLAVGQRARAYFERQHDWRYWQDRQAEWLLEICGRTSRGTPGHSGERFDHRLA